MQKTSSLLLNIQATLIDPSFSKEANIGECIRMIVNKCQESQLLTRRASELVTKHCCLLQ